MDGPQVQDSAPSPTSPRSSGIRPSWMEQRSGRNQVITPQQPQATPSVKFESPSRPGVSPPLPSAPVSILPSDAQPHQQPNNGQSSRSASPPARPAVGFRKSATAEKRDYLVRKPGNDQALYSPPYLSPLGSPNVLSPRTSTEVILDLSNLKLGADLNDSDQTNTSSKGASTPPGTVTPSPINVASSFSTSSPNLKTRGHKSAPRSEVVCVMDEEKFNNEIFNYPEVVIDFAIHNKPRDRVAYEFLTTERTYTRSLSIFFHVWGPVMMETISSKKVRELMKQTLLSIEDILRVNMELFEQLQHKFENWSESQTIGDVLKIITPFLKMYQNYTMTHDEITQKVQKITEKDYKEKKFKAMLTTLESHPLSKSVILGSFLILPVQRIPRYVLLLNDLLKHTPESHPDFHALGDSLKIMKGVATIINEAMDVADAKRKVLTVQRLFGENVEIVASHRTLVLEGSIKKQCRKDKKTRRVFLFSDMLIYARPNPSTASATGKKQPKLLVSGQLLLEKTIIVDVPESGKSIQLWFEPQEKEIWLSELVRTVEKHNRGRENFQLNEESDLGVAPVWSPDDSVKACPLCDNKFTTINRRHHCRKCGKVVCGDCSRRKLFVPEVNMKKKCRVCDKCYFEYQYLYNTTG